MATIESILKTRTIEDPYYRAILNVMHSGAWLQTKMNLALKPHGLTEPQFNVLRILRGQDAKPMNLYEIAGRMVYPTSNVSRIVDKLIEKGLVTREANADNRRRVDILITRNGLALLAELQPVAESFFSDLARQLTEEQACQLNAALEAMRGEPDFGKKN